MTVLLPFVMAVLWLQPPAPPSAPDVPSREAIRALLQRGIDLRRAGQLDDAGRTILEAKAMAEALGDRERIATALINYSAVPGQQADYPAALAALDEAWSIAEELDHDDLRASVLANRGILARLLGDYDAALETYTEALAIARRQRQRDTESRVLTNIGLVYAIQGHFREALDSYRASLAIRDTLPGGGDPGSTINNIGVVYETQGNSELALEYYQRALTIAERTGGDAVSPLSNIAHVYSMEGRRAEALRYFQRALERRQAAGARAGVAESLYNIATIAAAERRYDEALAGHQRSLAMRDEIHDQQGIAESLTAIAETLVSLNRLEDARTATARAERTARAIKSNELLWKPQVLDGQILRQLGDLDGSAAAYRDAIATIEALRDEVAGGSESRERFFEDRVVAYRGLVSTLVATKHVDEALQISERAHGRVLAESLQKGAGTLLPLSPAERDRQHALERDVVSLTARVGALERQTPVPAALAATADRLRQARLEYDRFRDELDARYPVRRLVRGDVTDEVRAAARDLVQDARTAIVEYVVGDRETDLFVLTREGADAGVDVRAFTIPIARDALVKQIARFQQKLSARALDFHGDARAIYDRLLRPAARALARRTHLIIVPDGALWYVPFEALEATPDVMLIDRAAISYAPSIAVLHAMHVRRAAFANLKSPRLLVAADPASAQPAIGAARQQADDLRRLYGAARTTVLVGDAAVEPRVRQAAADATVLHFATHGVLDDANPMYSFMQLTPTSGTDAAVDGRLEAWEIESLKLEAAVAVLTACDTGRGRVADGEGVIGLTWAFFAAGTPSTVVSLWKLESVSAAALTLAFHTRLRQSLGEGRGDVADSLRAAALALRRDPRYRHPFYWAGLVAVGDGF